MSYKLRAYARAGLVTMIVLLLLLVAFQLVWVTHGSATALLNQVGLQQTRSQRIAKDVLILAYRSSSEERAQALNELQATLPLFQQTQAGLQEGDVSLGLPKHPPQDVQFSLIQAQLDYVSFLNAAKAALAQTQHVDLAQVQIVLDHEQSYAQTMSNVVALWSQHINDAFQGLFDIECGLVVALLTMVFLMHFAVIRRALTFLTRYEIQMQTRVLPPLFLPVSQAGQESPISSPLEPQAEQEQTTQAQIDTPRI